MNTNPSSITSSKVFTKSVSRKPGPPGCGVCQISTMVKNFRQGTKYLKKLFDRILIANRGEIAVRLIRACKELEIESVAICSEVDRHAPHSCAADKVKCIGNETLTDSYLNTDKIITTALEMKCDAIHPGYGFLSENTDLVEMCEKNGIKFIGPTSEALRNFGNKNVARKLLKSEGVPIIPGTEDKLRDLEEAKRVAGYIGYPVMIKASLGGGGRGTKVAYNEEELANAFKLAQLEAKSAFGSDECYMEKYLKGIRHIEFQILADEEGNIIHLGERDCSIQRRHQKLLEEAPSPIMNEELRVQVGEIAIRAAKVGGYTNAGTVEFLFDENKNFYFLEINTRIQVEHPVTEAVTGIDLVKEQIRIAAGESLRYSQDDVKIRGHAIECRINAEDPCASFIPCPGKIVYYHAPGGPGIRIDSAMRSGYSIPPFYDSLIAKLIAWGENRQEAIIRMKRALDEYEIEGVKTTIPFHRELLENERFINGEISTEFVENEFIFSGQEYDEYKEVAIISAVLSTYLNQNQVYRLPFKENYFPSSWKLMGRLTEFPDRKELQKRRLVGKSMSIWSIMRNYRTYARLRP